MNMSQEEITNKVIQIVRESISNNFTAAVEHKANAGDIRSVNLIEDLGMDSVQILSLLMTLEEEFAIDLDEADVDLDKMMNVQALIEFVARKTVQAAA